MAITYRSPKRSRERILAVGMEGVGKSHALLTIARACPDVMFWIVDNDNAYQRLLEEEFQDLGVREEYYADGVTKPPKASDEPKPKWKRDERYEEPDGNIVIFHCDQWEHEIDAIAQIVDRCDRDDWMVLDSGSLLWPAVQDWFSRIVFGEGQADYFLQVRLQIEAKKRAASSSGKNEKDKKNLGAFDGWQDWGVINPQWNEYVAKYLKSPPCHLYVTAEQEPLGTDEKDKEVRGMWGAHSIKPRGQKRMGHNMQTCLIFKKQGKGQYQLITVKDRGRQELDRTSWSNFAKDYLVAIGGWKPAVYSTD